jgi:hypothetical protein
MQLPCKKCGFESPEDDHFCRQCGAALSAENEFSSAATINYGRQEAKRPSVGMHTGPLPPSVADSIAGETDRFYRPPQGVAMPAPAYPPQQMFYPLSNPESSSWGKAIGRFFRGIFFFLMIAGLVGATGAAVFFSQEARRERDRYGDIRRRTESRTNPNGKAKEAWQQFEEAVQLADEVNEKATIAGATLGTGTGSPVDLSKYTYKNASEDAALNNPGGETISMTTSDSLEDVRKHYESLVGKPVLQSHEETFARGQSMKLRKLLYQASPTAQILIRLEETYRYNGPEKDRLQVQITIFRTPLRFPQNGQ